MYTLDFHLGHFFRYVYGTEPFLAYCQQRQVPFAQPPNGLMTEEDFQRWAAACATLSQEQQLRIELEFAKVNEMTHSTALRHLVEAADGKDIPPDLIAGGAPLALWFLVHKPSLFHEVFLHQEIKDADSWQQARAPAGIALGQLEKKAKALARSLQDFFRLHEGTGRFCVVEAHRLRESFCFVAHVADRLRTMEAFTESGERTLERLRPAHQVMFANLPSDGALLLRCRLRSHQRILELFQRFGWAVLGMELGQECLGTVFDLEILKRDFRPLPDAADMEAIRIKSLHLRYPTQEGRRQVKLETLSSDEPAAIPKLLRTHIGGEGMLGQLQVCHAELQILLRTEGRVQSHIIRLWPHRSNVGQTPVGERFRDCLRRWGLCHAHP